MDDSGGDTQTPAGNNLQLVYYPHHPLLSQLNFNLDGVVYRHILSIVDSSLRGWDKPNCLEPGNDT